MPEEEDNFKLSENQTQVEQSQEGPNNQLGRISGSTIADNVFVFVVY
jgi:hypothetical protein